MTALSMLVGCPAGKSDSERHSDELWSQDSWGCPAGCQVSRAAAHCHIGGLLFRDRAAWVCRARELRRCQCSAGCLDEHSKLSSECSTRVDPMCTLFTSVQHWDTIQALLWHGSQGIAEVSLQWGAWAGSGMAAQEGPLLARLARLGMGAVDPAQGLTALQAAMQGMLMSYQPDA